MAANATSATCPGCGEILQIGAPTGSRSPSKTLPLTSGPGAVKPVPDTPLPTPDPFGDDLPGMVEGEEIDMGFFESADPSSPAPPADDIPEAGAMPSPGGPPSSRPAMPPPIPPEQPPSDDDGVLAKIALAKAKSDGSKVLPPLMPADDVPEAGAMPVKEKAPPVQAKREASKPPPSILAGPATPPIKMPDQGIDVTIPLAPVEEVSRRDTGTMTAMEDPAKARRGRETGNHAAPSTATATAYKQTGSQASAQPGSRRILVILAVALLVVAAAAAAYFVLGN